MKVTGIICEYNPFHYGHLYHIQEARKQTNCDVLVCIMSGNFVQRGEPAIINKWERTKTALRYGCDIVIELPFPYVVQSASYFASHAVDLLALAHVDHIVFGSEIGDIEMLTKIAEIDGSKYKDLMKDGLSCVKAYEMIYGTMHANDILGLNYIQACKRHNITPLCIKRTNAYHETALNEHSFSSATSIRQALHKKENVEKQTPMNFSSQQLPTLDTYYPYLRQLLLTMDPTVLSTYFLMDEGIEHQLIKNAKQHDDFSSFLQASCSKRYTKSKLQRTLIHLLTQTTKQQMNQLPNCEHLRLLGFNEIGKQYIRTLKNKDVVIASKFKQIPLPFRQMETKAAITYALACHQNVTDALQAELQSPIQWRKPL